jgi:hypothetical protein
VTPKIVRTSKSKKTTSRTNCARPRISGSGIDWLATKKPEIASTSLAFYQNSLGKFLEFLGPKADEPMRDVTKADIIAFRNRLLNPSIRENRES